jgi:hypothetical protein
MLNFENIPKYSFFPILPYKHSIYIPCILTSKVLQLLSIKTASIQPLSKARWIVQILSIFWYF